jgi:hypothetical protein
MKSLGIPRHADYILFQDRARSLREAELIPLHPRRNRPFVYAKEAWTGTKGSGRRLGARAVRQAKG